jgi:hypothetical protein
LKKSCSYSPSEQSFFKFFQNMLSDFPDDTQNSKMMKSGFEWVNGACVFEIWTWVSPKVILMYKLYNASVYIVACVNLGWNQNFLPLFSMDIFQDGGKDLENIACILR